MTKLKKDVGTELVKAGTCAAVGAATGGITAASVGTIGLASSGTAQSIGAAPIVCGGAAVGLLFYGVVSLLEELFD